MIHTKHVSHTLRLTHTSGARWFTRPMTSGNWGMENLLILEMSCPLYTPSLLTEWVQKHPEANGPTIVAERACRNSVLHARQDPCQALTHPNLLPDPQERNNAYIDLGNDLENAVRY
jgi:hypothetical protein